MTPQSYVQEKAASSGSSFLAAFRFLPKERRDALTAFYAFCREVDDVVDEVNDPSVASQKLAWWRLEVANTWEGKPSHPVMLALRPHIETYAIGVQCLQSIIDGCEMDLHQSRYLDYPALEKYCHLVAGVVGEVASGIFGRQDEGTIQYAHTLGLALQLTNIIRDVGDDARRGRIYLPIDELQTYEVKAHELLKTTRPWGYSERYQALMRFQAQRAHEAYERAYRQLPDTDRRAQRPGLIMANIYRTLLREIESDGFQVLHQRIALGTGLKIWIALRTWVTAQSL